jgi:plastocyanin
MKHLSLFAVLAVALTIPVALASAAGSSKNTVLIRHQVAHCHAWSFDGGKFVAAASGTVAKGGTIAFTNNDVMSHRLFEKKGPAVTFVGSPNLNKLGSKVIVRFRTAGTYVFGTKPGEDYMKGITTTGADNVLTLKITVK